MRERLDTMVSFRQSGRKVTRLGQVEKLIPHTLVSPFRSCACQDSIVVVSYLTVVSENSGFIFYAVCLHVLGPPKMPVMA